MYDSGVYNPFFDGLCPWVGCKREKLVQMKTEGKKLRVVEEKCPSLWGRNTIALKKINIPLKSPKNVKNEREPYVRR